ncbi:MAG: sulfurtransferase [Quisquiliibacterium sp.]
MLKPRSLETPCLNLAAYRFSPVADPVALSAQLRQAGQALGVRGTILVAPEGLNLFIAGLPAACAAMLDAVRGVPGFAQIEAKQSWSDQVPFKRFKVRVKREIIRMDQPGLEPGLRRAPAVDAPTLARWLDAGHDDSGRPVVMLDARNAFEVDTGAFAGAIDWRIGKFTEFAQALREHRAELAGKTVVSYCTGGIRCEKAALFMQREGIEHSYQLDGGILKYLEITDGRHFKGSCFVFDERVALSHDDALGPGAQARG